MMARNMVYRISLLFAAGVCGSCGPEAPRPPQKPAPPPTLAAKPAGLDVGDVECALAFDAVLAERSQAPNIKCEELVNARQQLDLATLAVAPPYPTELWITMRLSLTSPLEDVRVIFRAAVFRDKQKIKSFAWLLDSNKPATPCEYTFDAFAGLDPLPKTLLISGQAVVILLPEDADPAEIDIEAYAGDPEHTGAVLSNPIRINRTTPGPPQEKEAMP